MAEKWKILYEDEEMIVCDKPAGIAVQSRKLGKQDLEGMVRSYLMKKSGRRDMFVAAVHRLDQPVEGIVVLAKSSQAAAKMSARMQEWKKIYLAVVEGEMHDMQGVLVDYLKKDGKTNTSQVVSASEPGAKESRLEYQVIATKENQQLLKIHLSTGRHHQIRVQMSHAGHPLVGDAKYNPNKESGTSETALCAAGLKMVHPLTGENMFLYKMPRGKAFAGWEISEDILTDREQES